MRSGPWHQCGNRSQRLVLEQLQSGAGVGVVISPRDLSQQKAIEYAQEYHQLGAHVLIDQQFYVPQFTNSLLDSYGISQYRQSASNLHQISDTSLDLLASGLRTIHHDLHADGVIAPAVVYEAARPDIVALNARLFSAAKRVGDELSIPTYATVMIGHSATTSDQVLDATLSHATALDSNGWYFGLEFRPSRVPSLREEVLRFCSAGLTLAGTGKPVMHAYAGPMAILSFGFGATASAIGHARNLWQFTRGRWQAGSNQGGGGDAPPRLFSANLWGTIVYPDEIAQLSGPLRLQVFTPSPFSPLSVTGPLTPWDRWSANKHFVHSVCTAVSTIALNSTDARANANAAIVLLKNAQALHGNIASAGIRLRDDTNVYQANWAAALSALVASRSADFDYLALLAP